VLCPGKPQTMQFVKDVLDEVMELFPGETIHIGGDECPRTRWKTCPDCQALIQREGLKNEDAMQNWFTRQVMAYLHDHGRRLQGWNEIMHGGELPDDVIVQQWNDAKAAITAARDGNDVVVSPTKYCYFDYPYTTTPLRKVYAGEPTPPELAATEFERHILGMQANLWTEWRPTDASCDEFTWPRLAALAEVGWSGKDARDVDDFMRRMSESHYRRLATRGLGAPSTQPADVIEQELARRGDIVEEPKKKR